MINVLGGIFFKVALITSCRIIKNGALFQGYNLTGYGTKSRLCHAGCNSVLGDTVKDHKCLDIKPSSIPEDTPIVCQWSLFIRILSVLQITQILSTSTMWHWFLAICRLVLQSKAAILTGLQTITHYQTNSVSDHLTCADAVSFCKSLAIYINFYRQHEIISITKG